MSLFVIGDLHFSLCTDKPMDVFKGWHNYVERLCTNWRACVTAQDTVIIPGDITWAMTLEQARADFELLDSLPGTKYILKGNHDYWWSTRSKAEAFFTANGFNTLNILHNSAARIGSLAVCGTRGWFYDAGEQADVKVIEREAGRLKASITQAKALGGEPVVFLHYPPFMDDRICEPIYTVLVREGIKRCFYGHLHGWVSSENAYRVADGIEFRLISADHLDFCPKLIV